MKTSPGGGGARKKPPRDVEGGGSGTQSSFGCRALARRPAVLLLLLVVLLVAALAAAAAHPRHAEVAAAMTAKARLTAATAKAKASDTVARLVKQASVVVAAAAAGTPRPRPAPPVDRPAGLPRTAFDRHMVPAMTPGEALTLAWYASQANTYVEYGSGASTVQAAPLARRALSIENGVPWCREMEARADVRFWVAQGKLEYACVDVGKTGKRGMEGYVRYERKREKGERGWGGRRGGGRPPILSRWAMGRACVDAPPSSRRPTAPPSAPCGRGGATGPRERRRGSFHRAPDPTPAP